MYYHALFDEQDIRKMGNLIVYLPLSYIFIFIGSTCIMGFPFLTGFYSKDLILEFTFSRYLLDGLFIYILGLFAAFFTALYSSRMLLFIFILNNNSNSNKILNEYSFNMIYSVFLLTFLSIFVGFFFSDLFLG